MVTRRSMFNKSGGKSRKSRKSRKSSNSRRATKKRGNGRKGGKHTRLRHQTGQGGVLSSILPNDSYGSIGSFGQIGSIDSIGTHKSTKKNRKHIKERNERKDKLEEPGSTWKSVRTKRPKKKTPTNTWSRYQENHLRGDKGHPITFGGFM
jgi:hypothetical protein